MVHIYNDSNSKIRRRLLRRSQTDAENKLWQILRHSQMSGLKFFRQYSIDSYIVDFYCPKIRLAVEVDGGQHLENQYDLQRTNDLNQKGVVVLRFWNNEVLANAHGVYEKIETTVIPLLR